MKKTVCLLLAVLLLSGCSAALANESQPDPGSASIDGNSARPGADYADADNWAWFGIGEECKVFLIFLGGFFTILINVVDGIRQTDRKLIEVSRSMETPFLKHVFLLVIPHSAPNIFTGLRVGLSSCWMCVVAAELVSSTTGLGYMIMNARQFGQTDVVIVGMLTIGVLGKVMDSLLKVVEKAVIRWA